MAEMFHKADINKDEVMDLKEFQIGVMEHPVTSNIFQKKKIDAILELMWFNPVLEMFVKQRHQPAAGDW